ncbi:hypothetical protein AB0O34_29060 [Sphaerisporangium sp. NPDC088356]|uniref:hypothetical protein n=1 Tax=Sphaerisporangium sp. NPDC088356 TaxID=3154871 RepID=UPI003438688D
MSAILDAAIDDLVVVNRPAQIAILERVSGLLASSPAVTNLLVRGSFARGDSDRLSDVDLVIGVHAPTFSEFVGAHHALAATQLGAILPGWSDTIVPSMGGLGYVHLIEHDGKLCQLDLYLAPADRIDHIAAVTRGRAIYTAPYGGDRLHDRAAAAFVADRLAAAPTCEQLFVETLVLTWMIHKRILRGQQLMAYAETHMLHTAVRSLIRTALTPERAQYGWYHLDTEIGRTPIGRWCLAQLDALITSPPVPTMRSLAESLERILALAHRAVPETMAALGPAIDAYRYHLELD